MNSTTDQVAEIVERVRPILAGNPSAVTGAALADLFAIWLVGHFDDRGPAETAELREELIDQWVKTARQLIEPNEKMILAGYRCEARK
jgi:hypothetical protein